MHACRRYVCCLSVHAHTSRRARAGVHAHTDAHLLLACKQDLCACTWHPVASLPRPRHSTALLQVPIGSTAAESKRVSPAGSRAAPGQVRRAQSTRGVRQSNHSVQELAPAQRPLTAESGCTSGQQPADLAFGRQPAVGASLPAAEVDVAAAGHMATRGCDGRNGSIQQAASVQAVVSLPAVQHIIMTHEWRCRIHHSWCVHQNAVAHVRSRVHVGTNIHCWGMICACMHVSYVTCACTREHISIHMHAHTFSHTHACTYTHACTHAYIHTHHCTQLNRHIYLLFTPITCMDT